MNQNMGEADSPAVATVGSLRSVDPDRIILKKIILTGYPQRVSKLKATIRYMFHSPEDVRWFKPIELWTKCGRRGRVKDSIGTHELEMDPQLPTVLLMGGGEGMGPVKKTAIAVGDSLFDKELAGRIFLLESKPTPQDYESSDNKGTSNSTKLFYVFRCSLTSEDMMWSHVVK